MGFPQGRVAVLLLSYNGEKFLGKCLSSILAQDFRGIDIFMVDNASKDGSVPFVRERFPQVEIFETGKNTGFGPGFNYGLRKILDDYEYIILLNEDVVLDRRCISRFVETLRGDPRAAICTGLVLSYDGKKVDNAGGIIVNILAGVVGGYLGDRALGEVGGIGKSKPFPISFGVAVAMGLNCSVIKRIGLFDESFFIYYDDVDLSWRVWRRGYKVLCNPQATIYHYGAASPKTKELSQFILGKVESNVLACYYKNFDSWLFLALLPTLILFRIGGSFLYLAVSPEVTVAKLKGFLSFWRNLPYYRNLRREESRFWEKSSLVVLRNNRAPLVSFARLFSGIASWFREIRGFMAGGRPAKYND